MKIFKLEPGDILVNVNQRHDPISLIKRWALGSPYEHVFMYMGRLALLRPGYTTSPLMNLTMIFESDGDGVVVESIRSRYGQEVVVLRLKSEHDRKRIPHVLDEAIKLASDPQSYYDYMCIVKYIIPRLIFRKLGLPIPVRYHRDPLMVCSEAVFEVYHRAGLVDILLSYCVPPLPGDFVTDSPLLEEAWAGRLTEELV